MQPEVLSPPHSHNSKANKAAQGKWLQIL